MLYAGLVWLRLTEKEFWQYTPKKFWALLNVHYQIEQRKYGGSEDDQGKQIVQDGYIDQIAGW